MFFSAEAQQEVLLGSYYWSLLVQDTGDGYTSDPTNTSGDVDSKYRIISRS